MMIAVSATDVAIKRADRNGTLRLRECLSRLGGTYVAICDDKGIIEAANDMNEARARIARVCK